MANMYGKTRFLPSALGNKRRNAALGPLVSFSNQINTSDTIWKDYFFDPLSVINPDPFVIAQGSLDIQISHLLTGQVLTLGEGNLDIGTAYSIGQALTFTLDSTIKTDINVNLIGFPFYISRSDTLIYEWQHNLTGFSSSIAQNSPLIPLDSSLTLTGQIISLTEDSLSYTWDELISGFASSIAQGTVSIPAGSDVTVNLIGQTLSLTFSSTLTSEIGINLIGFPLYVTRGSITENVSGDIAVNISGILLTLSRGTPSSNFDFSLALTGQVITLSRGTPFYSANETIVFLTSQLLILTQDTTVLDDSLPNLTGRFIALTLGTPSVFFGQFISLTGQILTLTRNNILTNGDISVNLTGISLVSGFANNSFNTTISYYPDGTPITFTEGTPAYPTGAITLTGQYTTFFQGAVLINNAQTVNITGQSISSSQGSISVAVVTPIDISGLSLSTAQGTLINFILFSSSLPSGINLSLAQGSITTSLVNITQSAIQGIALSTSIGNLLLDGLFYPTTFNLKLTQGDIELTGYDLQVFPTGLQLDISGEYVCLMIYENSSPTGGGSFDVEVSPTTSYLTEVATRPDFTGEHC